MRRRVLGTAVGFQVWRQLVASLVLAGLGVSGAVAQFSLTPIGEEMDTPPAMPSDLAFLVATDDQLEDLFIQRITQPLSVKQGEQLLGLVDGFDAKSVVLRTLGGDRFTVSAPGGDIILTFPTAASEVSLLEAPLPDPSVFVVPSFLSVPLPLGSGARAFGLGAFTAVADDATAASWNPAALTQLERMEASAVYRWSRKSLDYRGGDESLQPEDVTIESDGLNFLSLVVPFRVGRWPVVASLNTLEAFDTRGRFSATTRGERFDEFEDTQRDTFAASSSERRVFQNGEYRLDVFASAELEIIQHLRQEVQQSLMGTVDFEQRGVIEALAPALAIRPVPGVSLGASLKVFQDGGIGPSIHSRTRVETTVETRSTIRRDTERVVNGFIRSEGELLLFPGDPVDPFPIPVLPVSASLPEFRESQREESETVRITETQFEETETLSNLKGMTPTFGTLWDATPWLSFGASFEPGWTAEGRQTRLRETHILTRDPSGRVLSEQRERTSESENIEIDFPLRWSAGAAIRFSPDVLLSMDVGQRLYSDFTARGADGVERNPLTGKRSAEDPLDDTWRAAIGLETLIPFGRRFIPLRAGYEWEEMPAVGEPDPFHAVSVGTGWVSDRVVIDLSYQHRWGDDVLTQVPSREDISADAKQDFIACSLLFYF